MAAELVAQCCVHLRGERVLAARAEALVERRRDHGSRDPLVDRVLDRPAALPGVLDIRLEALEVVALELERTRREFAQPRSDDRALHPEVRDLRIVELELAGIEKREALRIRLHHPVLDAVVNHLYIVAGAGRTEVAPTWPVLLGGRRSKHVEDRREPLDGFVGPTDHHAVAHLEAPHATGHSDVAVMDALRDERLGTGLVIGPAAVAAVDDHVPLLEQLGELVHRLLRGLAGRNHDPEVARLLELRNEVLERLSPTGPDALCLLDRLGAEVERDDVVLRIALDPVDHVAAHAAEPYEADLHQSISSIRSWTAFTGSPSRRMRVTGRSCACSVR